MSISVNNGILEIKYNFNRNNIKTNILAKFYVGNLDVSRVMEIVEGIKKD